MIYTERNKPYTYTMDSLFDNTELLTNVELSPYDLNTFMFRHPKLARDGEERNEPNDIKKLSIKTMADYILKFGLTIDDPDAPIITAKHDKTFSVIFYTGNDEPPYGDNTSAFNDNKPATVQDLIDTLNSTVLEPVFTQLLSNEVNAFNEINSIKPDYILSLDKNLTESLLYNLTGEKYIERLFSDFLFIGNNTDFITQITDGMLKPADLHVLIRHTHANVSKAHNNFASPISTKGSGTNMVGTEGGDHNKRSMVLNSNSTHLVDVAWDSRGTGIPIFSIDGLAAITAEPGASYDVTGNIEDQIKMNNVTVTCKKNSLTTSPNYIPNIDKVSVRYKARHYRLFEKVNNP